MGDSITGQAGVKKTPDTAKANAAQEVNRGSALAALVWKTLNEQAGKQKRLLRDIMALQLEGHIQFRKEIRATLEEARLAVATKVSKKEQGAYQRTLANMKVPVSEMSKFSEACSAGFRIPEAKLVDGKTTYAWCITQARLFIASKAMASAVQAGTVKLDDKGQPLANAIGMPVTTGRPTKPLIDKVRDFIVGLEPKAADLAKIEALVRLMQNKAEFRRAEKARLQAIEEAKQAAIKAKSDKAKADKLSTLKAIEATVAPKTASVHQLRQPKTKAVKAFEAETEQLRAAAQGGENHPQGVGV